MLLWLQWLVLDGYGFYWPDLTETAVKLAKEEGVRVALDLASFEVGFVHVSIS